MGIRSLFLLGVLLALLLSTGLTVAADPVSPGDVLINEFVANSAATEWVELYNTTDATVDVSGYYIDDINAGGGSPKAIPAGVVIPARGYYVLYFKSFLNNGGDDVRFLNPAQVVLDETTYTYTTPEYSWYRYPDGGRWIGIESSSPTPGRSNPGTGDFPWQPGSFEIRVFDVDQGDSQLIIFPSGYSILIDVAEKSWNTGKGAALIAAKIRTITGGSHVNVGVLSHLHLDHVGYSGYGGFWALLEEEGITFDKIIDRDAGVWVDGHNGGPVNGECEGIEIDWHNAGTKSDSEAGTGTAENWLCYATDPANSKIYPIRELAQLGSVDQIDPPDAGAVVEIVQVDAAGVMMADGVTPVAGDHTAMALPPSENDYCIGLKISYGTIDYATAGDTDGVYRTSVHDYTYNDVESIIAPWFGQVEILHANHHGSDHSNNQTYVDTLNPDVTFISCGDNDYGHPSQAVLDRLLATGQVYLTNLCDVTKDYGEATIVNGDIIVRSTDGATYYFIPESVFLPLVLTQ
jgi:hypothetical protein